jgi:hypothetical protein
MFFKHLDTHLASDRAEATPFMLLDGHERFFGSFAILMTLTQDGHMHGCTIWYTFVASR